MKTLPRITLAFALVKILLHLATADNLGFHRDEFLYLALGRHLDWGFWSNGPFIAAVSWWSQTFLGGSLLATRLLPALAGGGLVLLTGVMVRDLGGGRFAQILCGVVMLGSVAWLRTFGMLQPVPFDVLFWALLSFGLLRWLKTENPRSWWAIGAIAGLGFLNKYTLVFCAAGLILALLLTPQRRALATRWPWLATGLALLIALPNLWWQGQHNWPVVGHMRELAESQLTHVEPLHFLLDQLLMQGPGGALIWVAGLVFLLRAEVMRPYRLLGWHYVAVLLIFLILNGKSYYTLGVYPVLIAAGAVCWERILQKIWTRALLVALVIGLAVPLIPTGIPLWPAERLVPYFRWLSHEGPIEAAVRWEDGELHALPQDYADMLGWPELAALVDTAFARVDDPANVLCYGENYGQAGAVEQLGALHLARPMHTFYDKRYAVTEGLVRYATGGGPHLASFSDSYRLWVRDQLPERVNTFIYINDELGEDVAALFTDIQKIGEITNPLARERGTCVWLCRAPRGRFPEFWAMRVREVKMEYGL